MYKLSLIAIVAAVLSFGCDMFDRSHDDGSQATMSNRDRDFINSAAIAGMYEVEAARVAQTRAQSQPVKDFAQMMITDHSKANSELRDYAQKKGISLPGALDNKHRGMVYELNRTATADFDRTYIRQQVKAHEETIANFESWSKNGNEAEGKAWAGKTLPTLRAHLGHAKSMER